MSSSGCKRFLRSVSVSLGAVLLAVGFLSAQSSSSSDSSTSSSLAAGEASSTAYQLVADATPGEGRAMHAMQSQDDQGGTPAGHGWKNEISHHFAAELGGGFNSPLGNDGPYITWGGNLTAGAGLHLSKRVAVLGEFQFLDNKLPGAFVAAGGGDNGNTHIISLTVDPVVDLFPKRTNSVYFTGGGGYYHKSTNFNVLGGYDFYGYPVFVTANSFSSNQGGFSGGFGLTHRFGGVYGDGTMKVFAEARYLYINTPSISQTNGLGTTGLIPVTVGLRW
jgi:hypothetical protein